MTSMHEWERVNDTVWRFRVPGGWLYQIADDNVMQPPVFVPYSETLTENT